MPKPFVQLFDELGREIPDTTPIAMPLRFRNLKPPDLRDQVRALVQEQMSQVAGMRGYETFEEADDFDVPDDDGDLVSPYEMSEMQEEFAMGVDAHEELGYTKHVVKPKGDKDETVKRSVERESGESGEDRAERDERDAEA